MSNYTPVELVVSDDHTEGYHVLGFVLDGAFHPVTATKSGVVRDTIEAVRERGDENPHPLAVKAASGKSSGKG